MRLIDADALKKSIKSYADDQYAENEYLGEYTIMDIIDSAPTVELDESVIQETLNKRCMTAVANEYLIALHGKRSQGKWIFHKDYNESCRYGCNQCGNLTNIPGNFCPNCGAMMQKGGADND